MSATALTTPVPGQSESRRPTRRLVTAGAVAGPLLTSAAAASVFRPHLETFVLSHLVVRTNLPAGTLEAADPSRPTFVLVVGSDRRVGLAAGHGASFGEVAGQRADAVEVVRMHPDGRVQVLSLPRDLRVSIPGMGTQRLSAYYEDGPAALVTAVRQLTGMGVHHLVEVDFAGLVAAVDGVDGVTLDFPHPARDTVSGFSTAPGRQRLDGEAALAYVRSRNYEEAWDGRWHRSDGGDLDRIQRRQRLLAALVQRGGDPVNLPRSLSLLRALPGHVAVDDTLPDGRLRALLRSLASGPVLFATLPAATALPNSEQISPFAPAHYGAVEYLVAQQPAAERMLGDFRAGRDLAAGVR